MLAGGMTIAAPGFMPAAFAANANLFVSAENSQFDNYMSGPQVIEVVVIDSDINDTDEAKGEPDVTVNGKILRMVQGVDGNWYGYFADRTMAQIADSTAPTQSSGSQGNGTDFGTFCSPSTAGLAAVVGGAAAIDLSDTNGVAIPADGGIDGSATGAPITAACSALGTAINMNVVRESKDPVAAKAGPPVVAAGQIDIDPAAWPFVQLYTLNPTGNVSYSTTKVVVLNQ
jgi:hypothetical protein